MRTFRFWVWARPMVALVAVAAMATVAGADFVEDFEPGTTYAGTGTIQVDPEDAGNQVLLLAPGEVTTFATGATAGVLTLRIYDFGEIPNVYGPRWGLSDADESIAATIIQKSFLHADQGYGASTETSRTGSWWSPMYFGGPRQATLDDPLTVGVDERAGAWSTWTFTVAADGSVNVATSFSTQDYAAAVSDVDTVWLFGGQAPDVVDGLLVDDITWAVPEPATISLIGFGLASMAVRRRKRK